MKSSRGTSESTRLGIAAPRNTTNAGNARLAPQGQCPNLGGDARRRRKTERGGFSASLLSRETPRSVLGGFAACVAPDLAELSAQDAKHTLAADEHTLKRRPAPDGTSKGNFRHNLIGRGGGSPNLAR